MMVRTEVTDPVVWGRVKEPVGTLLRANSIVARTDEQAEC
jgi:hypothetical protein